MTPEPPTDLPPGATRFPPSHERPADYPAGLPFVPGVACMVHERTDPQGEPIMLCTWIAADEEPGAMDEYRALMRPLTEKLEGLPLLGAMAKLMGGGEVRPPAETARMAEEARRLVAEAPPEERDAVFEVERVRQEALRASPETEDAADRVTRAVVAASEEEGWEVRGEQPLFPPGTRMVRLQRGNRSRAITRMAAAFGGHVMLMESPVRDEDTAPATDSADVPHRS